MKRLLFLPLLFSPFLSACNKGRDFLAFHYDVSLVKPDDKRLEILGNLQDLVAVLEVLPASDGPLQQVTWDGKVLDLGKAVDTAEGSRLLPIRSDSRPAPDQRHDLILTTDRDGCQRNVFFPSDLQENGIPWIRGSLSTVRQGFYPGDMAKTACGTCCCFLPLVLLDGFRTGFGLWGIWGRHPRLFC